MSDQIAGTRFTWTMFASDGRKYGLPLTPIPSNLRPFTERLCRELAVLEHALGREIDVISGFRTPAHNTAAKGAKGSQHMQAKAADFVVPGLTDVQIWCTVRGLILRGAMRPGGLGYYKNGTSAHYDIRGTFTPYGGMDGSIPLPDCTGVTLPPVPKRPEPEPVPTPNLEEDEMDIEFFLDDTKSQAVYAVPTNGIAWAIPNNAALQALKKKHPSAETVSATPEEIARLASTHLT